MLTKLRNILPGVCPLCQLSAPLGQFCQFCQTNILHSHSYAHRCPICQLALTPNTSCPNCHEHSIVLQRVYAAFDYIPPLDSLILQFKNAGRTQFVRAFVQLLIQQLPTDRPPAGTYLIPIPSSVASLRKRGFNPATLFAKELAKNLQYRLALNLLHRRDSLFAQKMLSRTERFLHSSQLYYCAHRFEIEHVVLVDDVFTTGGTLDSAARALIAAGVKRVDAMVIARTANPL